MEQQNNESLSHKAINFIKENKTNIISLFTTLVNVIVLAVVSSSLNNKVQNLVGEVDAQVKFWNQLSELYKPLVLDSQKVSVALNQIKDLDIAVNTSVGNMRFVESEYRRRLIDFNQQSDYVKDNINFLSLINTSSLSEMTNSVQNIKPMNEALSLYAKLLNYDISSYNLKISGCEHIQALIRYNELNVKISSNDCKMKLVDGYFQRLYRFNQGFTNFEWMVNSTNIVRITNGVFHYNINRERMAQNTNYQLCTGGLTGLSGQYQWDEVMFVNGSIFNDNFQTIYEPGYNDQATCSANRYI